MSNIANPTPDLASLRAQGWAALPATYAIPSIASSLVQARRYCQPLANG